MQGRRVEYRETWEAGKGPKPGDYWQTEDGAWGGVTPNGLFCNLRNHQVTVNEDGTITVSPSIKVFGGDPGTWHGYLERGVWREC